MIPCLTKAQESLWRLQIISKMLREKSLIQTHKSEEERKIITRQMFTIVPKR